MEGLNKMRWRELRIYHLEIRLRDFVGETLDFLRAVCCAGCLHCIYCALNEAQLFQLELKFCQLSDHERLTTKSSNSGLSFYRTWMTCAELIRCCQRKF